MTTVNLPSERTSRHRARLDCDRRLASDLVAGAIGGFAGTVAMTLAMELLRRGPHGRTRVPFPPRLVAMGVAGKAGIRKHLGRRLRTAVTLASHFAYGSGMGGLFPLLTRRLGWRASARGAAYGMGVWAASYSGWLPSLGVLAPPQRRSFRQNLTLILSHLVWGATLGAVSGTPAVRGFMDSSRPAGAIP